MWNFLDLVLCKFPLILKPSILKGSSLSRKLNNLNSFRKYLKLTRFTKPLSVRVNNPDADIKTTTTTTLIWQCQMPGRNRNQQAAWKRVIPTGALGRSTLQIVEPPTGYAESTSFPAFVNCHTCFHDTAVFEPFLILWVTSHHIPVSTLNKTHGSPSWSLVRTTLWLVMGFLSGVSRCICCVCHTGKLWAHKIDPDHNVCTCQDNMLHTMHVYNF